MLRVEKERNTLSSMKKELQLALSEGRPIDISKFMVNLETYKLEYMRLQSEHKDRAQEVRSLKQDLKQGKKQEKWKIKVRNQLATLRTVFKKHEANLRQREEVVNLKNNQVEAFWSRSSKPGTIEKEISKAEKTISALENIHSENIVKALTIRKHDKELLGELRDVKKKMHSQIEKLKTDRVGIVDKLNQLQETSIQIKEAQQVVDEEISSNNIWGEELKKLDAANAAQHEGSMAGFQKARERLNAKLEKMENFKITLVKDKVELKQSMVVKIDEMGKMRDAAYLDLKLQGEKFQKRLEALDQTQRDLEVRDRKLNEGLSNAESQMTELTKSKESQTILDELGSRVDKLSLKLLEVKNEKEKLEGPYKVAQDKLVCQKNKFVKVKEELKTEKAACARLSEQLSDCKDAIEGMKGQTIKYQVEKEVWESMTERIIGERDTLINEEQELRTKAQKLRKRLQMCTKKIQEVKDENIAGSIYKHHRNVSMMSSQHALPSEKVDFDNKQSTGSCNFEKLLQNIMDSHQSLVENRSKVEKRMEQLVADLEVDEIDPYTDPSEYEAEYLDDDDDEEDVIELSPVIEKEFRDVFQT